jgi:hypothetical protein
MPPDIEQKLASTVVPEAIQVAFNQNTDVRNVPVSDYSAETFRVHRMTAKAK